MITEKEFLAKQHTILSRAIQIVTDEQYDKFVGAEKLNGSIQGNTIKITGDLNILKSETFEKTIEFNGEKETCTIVLIPL